MIRTQTTPAAPSTAPGERTLALVADHFGRSIDAADRFFDTYASDIARTCRLMAERFEAGGSLIVFGEGAQATDAQHVAVEFVHPVLVGKRALPAIALTSDAAVLTGLTRVSPRDMFAVPLGIIGTPKDIALGLCGGSASDAVSAALRTARAHGMLTVLCCGGNPVGAAADRGFGVPEDDPFVVQEVQETLYHVLWEVVHVFLDSQGAIHEMHPFLAGSTSSIDVLAEATASTRQKGRDICNLRRQVQAAAAPRIAEAADAIAERFRRGGRLLAFGNGGSATDAQDAAADCMTPPIADWRRLPALSITNDVGVITAVGNDVGFDHVFARQVVAFGRREDIALGISTSGTSRNVIRALEEARARGLLTIALSGYDGGALARSEAVDVCITAANDYVPRVQEAHATIWHALLKAVQAVLA